MFGQTVQNESLRTSRTVRQVQEGDADETCQKFSAGRRQEENRRALKEVSVCFAKNRTGCSCVTRNVFQIEIVHR